VTLTILVVEPQQREQQIVGHPAVAITKDIFVRLAPSKATLYNISALLPEAAWLGSVAKHDEPAMTAKHILGLCTGMRGREFSEVRTQDAA
jgi:hypothetical protein